MEVGQRIAAWRRYRKWTQSSLALKAGRSRALICQVEGAGKYKTTPSQRTLAKILAALEVTFEQFYGPIPTAPRAKKSRAAA